MRGTGLFVVIWVHLYYIVVHQPDAYIRQVHLYYREREGEREREEQYGWFGLSGVSGLSSQGKTMYYRGEIIYSGVKPFILG